MPGAQTAGGGGGGGGGADSRVASKGSRVSRRAGE